MTFLLAYLNVHYLILLPMVHEYAYFYEYIWKMVSRPSFASIWESGGLKQWAAPTQEQSAAACQIIPRLRRSAKDALVTK